MNKERSHSDHLTRKEILLYLDAKCTEEEMYKIERHLLQCELCQEAMEGYESSAAGLDLEQDLFQLDAKLSKRVVVSKKRKIAIWRVAAIALLLIISGYFINTFLFNSSQNIQLTEKKEVKPARDSINTEAKKKSFSSEQSPSISSDKEAEKEKSEDLPKSKALIVENNLAEENLEVENIDEEIVYESVELESDIASFESEDPEMEDVKISAYNEPLIEKDAASEQEVVEIERRQIENVSGQVAGVRSTKVSAERSGAQKEFKDSVSDSQQIQGVVVDKETQEPIPFVIIENKTKEKATTTDMDGKYQIEAEEGDEIELSSVGYTAERIEISNDGTLDIAMSAGESLDEVIVSSSKEKKIKENQASPLMGEAAFKNYLKENLIYPEEAKTEGISGKVILEFTIDQQGYASDFVVLKGLGFGCDEEAIRLVKEGPVWIPATENGKLIEEKVKVKVIFK